MRLAHRDVLLIDLCRHDAERRLEGRSLSFLADPVQWEEFLELAKRHRVMGLVLNVLSRTEHLDASAGTLRAACANRLRLLRRRTASIELERDHLSEVLRETAPRATVLKGGALLGWVYDDPVERDVLDLDFLVPEDELRDAVRAFVGQGYRIPSLPRAVWQYRRHHFHMPMEKPGMLRVEMHWALDRASSPSPLDPVAFLEHAVEIDHAGRPLRCPRPEHVMLHLVQQNCHEGFSRLSRTVDLDRIGRAVPGLDWDFLVREARGSALAAPTGLSLELAGRLLGTAVPHRVADALRPGPVSRRQVAMLRPIHSMFAESKQRGDTARLLRLWLLPTLRSRLRYLRSLLSPDPSFPPRPEAPGVSERLVRLMKLGLFQLVVHLRALAFPFTRRGRAQMRFWSRNAKSSDLL